MPPYNAVGTVQKLSCANLERAWGGQWEDVQQMGEGIAGAWQTEGRTEGGQEGEREADQQYPTIVKEHCGAASGCSGLLRLWPPPEVA